jgi:type IV pilus assembly protein PilM
MQMPSLSNSKLNPSLSLTKLGRPSLKVGRPSFGASRGRKSDATIVGLDIQPGHVAAVQAHVNGRVVAEHALALPLPADTVREGEVLDEGALGETLRELFRDGKLDKRVRVGVANQRTVLRTLELPPVTDQKELDAAVRFRAQDEVPMPLESAVLDFQSLGINDTPEGQRQQVVLVAAQRDMISRLLDAVRGAGLRVEGIDLSAFALIRSLYSADPEHEGRVLYLNVDGLTNMAIAEGEICRFTRVVGGGLEAMASQLAERLSVPVEDARTMIAGADLSVPQSASDASVHTGGQPTDTGDEGGDDYVDDDDAPTDIHTNVASRQGSTEVRVVLDNGLREIAGEVRNSLDFHRSQEGGGEVARVVLSGAALDIPGFAANLQGELGVPVMPETVGTGDMLNDSVSPQRLAVAAGLAIEEARR